MLFAKRSFWFILSMAIMAVLISGCAQAQAPQPVVSNTAYPVDSGQSDPASAYPSGTSNKAPGQPIDAGKVVAPKEAPQPEPGKASVSGVIFSKASSTLLSGFQFYFTPAQGENADQVPPVLAGAFSEKGDILAKADAKSEFQINNIPPGNYYIILVSPGDYLVAVNSDTDDTPRMVTLNADEAKPLGLVVFP